MRKGRKGGSGLGQGYSKGRMENIQADDLHHNSLLTWQWEMGEKEKSVGVSGDICEDCRDGRSAVIE